MNPAPPPPERAQARVAWPFAIATAIWGSTWLVIVWQLPYAPAAWSVTWRFVLAGLAMAAVARGTGASLAIGREGQRLALVVGVAQFALNYLFVYAAEARIASGLVALVSALLIVPNALFGWWWLGRPVPRRFLAGSAIAIAGILLLFGEEVARASLPPGRIAAGVGLAIGGVLAASTANVLQATRAAARVPQASLLAWAMGYGSAIDAGYAWATVGPPVFSLAPRYLAGLLYLAIAGSAVAFSCYFHVIRRIGPARAGYIGVLVPVIAMGLSTLFEGYRWTAPAAAGAGLALVGLVVAMRARSPAR